MMLIAVAGAQVASHESTLAVPKATTATQQVPVLGKPVARINGAVLTDRDLVREMFAIFPYAKQHNGFPKDLEPQIRQGALEMIVFEELVYQEAQRRNLAIPPAKIARAETDFRKNFQTQGEYDQYLKIEVNGSRTLLRQKIRRSLLIEALLKSEVKDKSFVTPTQLKAYYEKNSKQFEHGETFHTQSISVLPPSDGTPATAKEARKKAEEAYSKAKNAKTYREFGLLAEKYSDDDFRVNMGDHKPVAASQFPPQLLSALAKMKPGDVSPLIQIGEAFTILRLEAHIPAGKTPFAEVQAKLKSDLQKENAQKAQTALAGRLKKSAKIEML